MIRVVAYTGGANVPSARFRVRQYLPVVPALGVEMRECTARFGAYPPPLRPIRPLWALATLGARLPGLARSYAADVSLLQRGLLSKYITLESLARTPRVLDVDDAIWLPGRESYARGLARLSEVVICGNAFLAEQFGRWHERVVVIPTPVDTARYMPAPPVGEALIIGWSGSSSGLRYLEAIEGSLVRVLARFPRAKLRVVSDRPPRLRGLAADRIEFIPWRSSQEVALLQGMSVGIMPLFNSDWSRGKCSFKMLTYMACGVPVVASPVGMNADVLARGTVGLAATGETEWTEALTRLLDDVALRRACGEAGRRVVEDHYSLERMAPRLAGVLRAVAAGTAPVPE
jgi:glycosyltransferase involved in cell wall biosynthesis